MARQFISLRLLSIAIASFAAGCGPQTMEPPPPGPSCGSPGRIGESDCSGVTTCNAGQYCDDSDFPTCVPGCTSDSNCGPNEFCARPVGEAIGACQACPVCGNGACEGGETATSCASDCTGGNPVCGNGACEAGETSASCAADCVAGTVCGNGVCEGGEFCPADCVGAVCGNFTCDAGETASSCPSDCDSGTVCGNGLCEIGETGTSCASDCGGGAVCGNHVCEAGESGASCPVDCSTTNCGNGFCEIGETATGCPSDCDDSEERCYDNCDDYEFFCEDPFDLTSCRNSCAFATTQQREQFNDCANTQAIDCNLACFAYLP